MTLIQVLIVLALIAAVAAVAAGRGGRGLGAPTQTRPWTGLPEGHLAADDIEHVRFTLGLRGYRMDQVDEVLDRLAGEIARRDVEIAGLLAELGIESSEREAETASGRSDQADRDQDREERRGEQDRAEQDRPQRDDPAAARAGRSAPPTGDA